MDRFARTGFCMGEYRNFVIRKNIIITTQILAFLEKGETLMLDQKK